MAAASAEALARAGAVSTTSALRPVLVLPQLVAFSRPTRYGWIRDPRGLTVTGGLAYPRCPASGYLTHSIVAMVERLRADAGALGWSARRHAHDKHVFGVYSSEPVQ